MHKIKSLGTNDPVLLMFAVYVSSRNQMVQVNGFTLHFRSANIGVIHGGAPAPTVYFVY